MAKKRRYNSTLARIEKIKAITAKHYEPGNQSRCYKAVWRRYIEPEYRISYDTYLRYMGAITGPEADTDNNPTLFSDLWSPS